MSRAKQDLVVVYEPPTQFMSQEVKTALENAGIPVLEQVERTWGLDNIDLSAVGRYSRLLTDRSRADEARQLVEDYLAAFEGGNLELPEANNDAGEEGEETSA